MKLLIIIKICSRTFHVLSRDEAYFVENTYSGMKYVRFHLQTPVNMMCIHHSYLWTNIIFGPNRDIRLEVDFFL